MSVAHRMLTLCHPSFAALTCHVNGLNRTTLGALSCVHQKDVPDNAMAYLCYADLAPATLCSSYLGGLHADSLEQLWVSERKLNKLTNLSQLLAHSTNIIIPNLNRSEAP